MTPDDQHCLQSRGWLSAFRDGEAGDNIDADAHLESCADCQAWATVSDQVTRQVRMRAPVAPTASAVWIENLPFDPATPAMRAGRMLLWVATVSGLFAVTLALAGLAGHAHLGSSDGRQAETMTLALIGGFGLAAWRPGRMAMGLLPVAAFAAAITFALSILELIGGRAQLVDEIWHLPIFLGAIGAALVVRGAPALTTIPTAPLRRRPVHGT